MLILLSKSGCPAWIRTMTKSSKDSCATITPPDKDGHNLAVGHCARKGKRIAPPSPGVSGQYRPPPAAQIRIMKDEATLEHFGFRVSAFFRPSDLGPRVCAI